MYQNIFFDNITKKIHLWDDTSGYRVIQYKKYAYVKHSSGNFTSLYGDKLQKVYKWDEHDQVFEADVPTETRVLVDEYTDSNSDIDFTANGFKIKCNAGGYNENNAKNLYLAFADQPFSLQARAR